jgi:ABC-type Fe3+/spermidine/putrescine transport system ATPase subunit
MVFQNYALYPHMTVRQNLGYALRVQKRPKREIAQRVGEIAKLLGLEELLDRRPGQLSGGQMQRVVLARSLAYDPDLLLLDEPLANLDAHLREEMRQELKRIQRETETTMIAVTHDQSEALALSDQIMVMSSGRVLQRGGPEEIFRRPQTAEVARFLGATNALSARRIDGRLAIEGLGPLPEGAEGAASVGSAEVLFRPSDVVIRPAGEAAAGGWPGEVVFAQYLGREVQYLVRCAGRELTAEVPSSSGVLPEGSAVSLQVVPGALFVYPEAA